MTLRKTEEEYEAWLKRRGQPVISAPYLDKRTAGDEDPRLTSSGDAEAPKKTKYGNRRTEVDGIMFDSRHEARVYGDLMMRVKSGELKCVLRQVKFDLGGGANAQKDSRYMYIADFVTIDRENHVEVLDAKSDATRKNRTYINKKKQMLAEWGIEIREV